jgi:hypothetical protein
MATLQSLQAERNRLIEKIGLTTAALESRRRVLARAENTLATTTDPARRARLEGQIEDFSRDVAAFAGELARLNQQLAEVNNQISNLQKNQKEGGGPAGAKASAADIVREDQAARANGSSPTAPPPPALKTGANGRIQAAPATTQPSNAQPFRPAFDQAVDAAVRKNKDTQSTPPITARPGPAQPSAGGPQPSATTGAAAAGDDNTNGVRNRLNVIFGGTTQQIITQPNVLDRYASYSYNISLYIISPQQYKDMLKTKTKKVNDFQLLIRSGGAPLSSGIIPQAGVADVGESPAVTQSLVTGRNQDFPLDFYIDDVQFRCYAPGKGSNGAHNVQDLSFKIIEPNGLTLLDRLYAASQRFNREQGIAATNYAAQTFLMVIRFYGYDADGNLVGPATGSVVNADGTRGVDQVIEKFIPFHFKSIKFRIANKLVEYACEAAPPPQVINQGIRGVIPANVEIPAKTLKDLFSGNGAGATASRGTDGRESPPPAEQAAVRRIDNQIISTQQRLEASNVPPGGLTGSLLNDELGISNDEPITAGASPTQNLAPANVNAAPNKNLVYGLMTALNKYQAEYVAKGEFVYPDEYRVVFTDPILSDAEVIPPGPTDKKSKPMSQSGTANQKLNPATGAVDNDSKTTSATAGMSVVQFIDQYTRASSYITKQQLKVATTDATGKITYIPQTAGAGQVIAWYRIGVEAEPLQYDPKRNDNAYRITYQISPYKINDLQSEYFPAPLYNGVHKKYNYWFTGQNTSVLKFEQDFNYLYYQTVNSSVDLQASNTTNAREYLRRVHQARSNESQQGISGPVLDASANAADYLYSPADQGQVSLQIIGDPSWIQQGEVWSGIAGLDFDYGAFLPDGTINYESQEALFQILFNKPVDYDLDTGIQDPGQKNYEANREQGLPGEATQNYTYRLKEIENTFSRGGFTQELRGTIVNFPLPTNVPDAPMRETVPATQQPSSAFLRGPDQTDAETKRLQAQSAQARFGGKTWADRQQQAAITMREARAGRAFQAGTTVDDTPLTADSLGAEGFAAPAPAAEPPTSSGQVVGPAASGSTAVAAQGGASGPRVGVPVSVQVFTRSGVKNVTSNAEIQTLFNQGEITAQERSQSAQALAIRQRAANSPVTNQPNQTIRRGT